MPIASQLVILAKGCTDLVLRGREKMNHQDFLNNKKKRLRAVGFFTKMNHPVKVEVEGETFVGSCIPEDTRATQQAVNLLRVKRVSLERERGVDWVSLLLSNAANHLMK